MILSAGIFSAGLSFTVAADGDMEEYLDHHFGMSPEQTVRAFDKICAQDDGEGLQIYARFLPNAFDYYAKSQPSAPITKGEHVRQQLILGKDNVEGFVQVVEESGITSRFFQLQVQEMQKALNEFDLLARGVRVVPLSELPPCGEPFPAPNT